MNNNCKAACALLAIAFLSQPSSTDAQAPIDLAGQWFVFMDRSGDFDPTAATDEQLSEFKPVQLPGTLRDSGLGDPVGPNTRWIADSRPELLKRSEYRKYQDPSRFKTPFWLQPERHYVGTAYYKRTVNIPESWSGQRILLWLERPHWRTKVWVDRELSGRGDSLSTPHVYDLTQQLAPGQHLLTIHVDNSLESLDVGVNSHSVSDHTQTAWHGVVGRMELRAGPLLTIENVQVFPAENARSAKISMQLTGVETANQDERVKLRISQQGQTLGQKVIDIEEANEDGAVECDLSFDRQAARWDEFHPNLCELEVALVSDEMQLTTKCVSFGVRHITSQGTQFLLNDRPIFLRGTLECCIFPLTGYPPTDVTSWKRIIRICKAHGLNHIRFHSWCPPEAAFVAADELGFYYQVECSTWPNQSTSLGNGKPVDEWLYREGERILNAYGNHPSFLMLAMGNEPGGPQQGAKYLAPWVEHFKSKTERQLVTGGAGWPSIAQNEFHVTPAPRIQQWGQGLGSRINALPPTTVVDYREFISRYDVPVVSHEIGQWCVYPNFDEIAKYTGSLKPRNFEIFRELLDEAHMLDQAKDFLMASGNLQALCYKEEIESALRTPGFGGFQLLDLHDFPGQGTALVGVLDPFWDSKPYLTPEEFSQFCGPTTPLARMAKRSWMNNETFAAQIEVCHFGPSGLPDASAHWSIARSGKIIRRGALPATDIPTGSLTQLGGIEFPLAEFTTPEKLTLRVWLEEDGSEHANEWDFWVYPVQLDATTTEDILLVRTLADVGLSHLEQGGTVVLFADPKQVKSNVQIGFSPIFWNMAWTGGQAPHTLGVLCNPEHPALAGFPTDYHSDWQWWDIVSESTPILMDDLPPKLRPIVQVVPDWFRPQRLGLVFEAKVGQGKLLVSSINLVDDLSRRPAARQLRQSLLRYAASNRFQPTTDVKADAIRDLFH
jgi:hypothetical protein